MTARVPGWSAFEGNPAMPRSDAEILGRDDVDDLDAILAITNTDVTETIHTVLDNADTIFTWDYERTRVPLSKLYEKAKTSQWNGETDLDWSIEVDPEYLARENVLTPTVEGIASVGIDLKGTSLASWTNDDWLQFGIERQKWSLSQFLHGEQGALLCTGKIVETVPWIDAKYYAATQVMDEARHVEVFAKYLDTKLDGRYPVNHHLEMLLDDVIADSRWDMTYLGMQIMVEGLALAAFGLAHQTTKDPLLKQLLRYVMSDEARHVAFGVISLQEYYKGLTDAELLDRQEFAFEAAVPDARPVPPAGGLGADGSGARRGHPRVQAGRPEAQERGPVPAAAVQQDRAELQEAGPARRQRRLAAGPVRHARREPVRGLGRHRRGVRAARRGRQGPRHRRRVRLLHDAPFAPSAARHPG